jgi:hypothetical protein
MRTSSLYQPRPHVQGAESARARDQRIARACQSRLDLLEDEMHTLEERGAAHFECARQCLRLLDDLAGRRFALMAAIARIEQRLVHDQAAAPARKANGRAVA